MCPTAQAFTFPSLCYQDMAEKQDEAAFATSYEMVKIGSQKAKVKYPDHTAELKLGPPSSSCWALPLIHTGVGRQHPRVPGRSRLADSFWPHLLQLGSPSKDRFAGCSFRGEISPWTLGTCFFVRAVSFLPPPVSTLLLHFPLNAEPDSLSLQG